MSEINFNNIQKNSDDDEEEYDNYVEDIVEDIDEDMNGGGDEEQQDIDYDDDDDDDDDDANEGEEENEKKDEDEDEDEDVDVDVDVDEDEDEDIDVEEEPSINKKDDSLLKSEGRVGGSVKEMTLISDYRKYKHLKTLSCSTKITRPILTKYEKTSILGQRAQQILNGSNILVDIKTLKIKNPLEIARKELKEGLIPFIVRRPLPNGTYEDWKVSDLKDINF
jgi:DNA-directed RNA polymerase I, II, and III subunit RPABC2